MWCGGRESLVFEYIFISFSSNKSEDYLHIYLHQKSFEEKKTFKTGFSEHLCIQNSQRLLCSGKTGIKTVFEHCVHNKI